MEGVMPTVTYPRWLQNRLAWWLWQRLCCPRGWHLWDEVISDRHYLVCDACETEVPIESHTSSQRGSDLT